MPSTNPYRYDNVEGNTTANSVGPRDVYHREAHGLTGEMFDACLREQFTAGADVGAREAWDEARRMMREQSARAWDEGYGSGCHAITTIAAGQYGQAQLPLANIQEIVGRSRMSKADREAIRRQVLGIERAFENIVEATEAQPE